MSDQIQQQKKKIDKVTDLIIAVYKQHIKMLWMTDNRDGSFKPHVVFKNKPEQSFCIIFIVRDTWAEIKRKMNKLIESDGLCVVCFEKEIFNNTKCHAEDCKCSIKLATPIQDSLYCFDCCEMVCLKCFDATQDVKCPVCRNSINDGFLRYYE